ncbi:MAG: cob(I)yrinic acid a,c-diamide adenosyltransferase, partial [Lentisphaerae bacterium]|nr:cob(I)yrinic acid a,c-diamide adenosyltransferase [Lentisphaerota bacterium]
LALRAVGAGLRVFFAQFIKQGDYSEIQALRRYLPQVTLRQYGAGKFILEQPDPESIRLAQDGLIELCRVLQSGEYDLVIADEANCAVKAGLFDESALLDLAAARPPHVELLITGRDAPRSLLEIADLVTEMCARKHPYDRGLPARTGIDC